jgi:glycosyltransferase involved in cell wall biosynthesis
VSQRIKVVSLMNELLFGGDENRLLSMSRTIDKARFDHRVITIKRPNAEVESYYGTMRGLYATAGVEVADLGEGYPNARVRPGNPVVVFNRATMLARTLQSFSRYVRRHEIDVIDAHLGPGNLVGVAVGRLTRTPAAVTTYHAEPWDPRWLWRRVHASVLRSATAVITDSEACGDTLRSFMGRPAAAIAIIPNGLDPPSSSRTRAEMRRSLGLPDDPRVRVIGQVATLLPTKGQMVLLDAAKIVLAATPDVAFLIVGFPRDAAYRDALIHRMEELGIRDRVRIVNYPGQIGDVWKAIDIHTHPTLLDSLPQAIMEAMSLGLPSVVTPIAGIPTMIDDEKTGLIVRAGDPGDLARALLRLLGDEQTAQRLGAAAAQRFRERYTTEIMTRSLEDLFARLAGA